MEINKLVKKVFGSAKSELYVKIYNILSFVASEKDYLENNTIHADAIHKHLSKIDIDEFENLLDEYFINFLNELRKLVTWDKITIAFDETFIPFYGKPSDNWVVGYNNKVKGAVGSFKFMVCSVVIKEKRYVLHVLPMHNNQDTNSTVYSMIDTIKSKFRIETILFDRGFCNKKLCRDLENMNCKYLILSPKRKDVLKMMESKTQEMIIKTIINENKSKKKYNWRYVFAYKSYGYDWAFVTNLKLNPNDLVKLYKCRWGIETNFRIMDFADIKSKSKNIVTRCFFFFISAVLFNSWLDLNKKITFEKYLDYLGLTSLTLNELILKFAEAKEYLGIKLTSEEEIILSSIINYAEFYGRFPCHVLRFQSCMNQTEIC